MHQLIFIFLIIFFYKTQELLAQDLLAMEPTDVVEIPLPSQTGNVQGDKPQPRSRLLRDHLERKSHGAETAREPAPQDFSESKLTYIERATSPFCSQQLTTIDSESHVEYITPTTSRPQVSFGESRTREYEPQSGKLLGEKETIKRVGETCWNNFGTVVAVTADVPHITPPETTLRDAVMSTSSAPLKDSTVETTSPTITLPPPLPSLPVPPRVLERRNAIVTTQLSPSISETLSMFGDPSEEIRRASGDIPYAPGLPPGVVVSDAEHIDERKKAQIHNRDVAHEQKIQKAYLDDRSQCCGCVVS